MLNRSFGAIIFGLGMACLALAPAPSLGHSPGLSVSLGSNPIRSTAGIIDLAVAPTAVGVISAPEDQDLVLTDVTLGLSTENNDARISGFVTMEGSDGIDYGAYVLQLGRIYDGGTSGASRQYVGSTGVRIPAGITVSLRWTNAYTSHGLSTHSIAYTLSGYLAKP